MYSWDMKAMYRANMVHMFAYDSREMRRKHIMIERVRCGANDM